MSFIYVLDNYITQICLWNMQRSFKVVQNMFFSDQRLMILLTGSGELKYHYLSEQRLMILLT